MKSLLINQQRRAFLSLTGLDPNDVIAWGHKFRDLGFNSDNKGVRCTLTFEEYVRLAIEAGVNKPSLIGRSTGEFQMGRLGDTGDYSPGNCRFITMEQNKIECKLNGGSSRQASKIRVKLSKRYRVVSPSGVVYEGLNLKAFCLEHNLHNGTMSQVLRGILTQHKGWTGTYKD